MQRTLFFVSSHTSIYMYHKPRFTDTYMLFTAHCLRLNADLDSNNLTEMAKKIFNVISVNRVILAYGTAILNDQ